MNPSYDSDFYAWTLEQSRLLRERKVDLLDWDNLSEEIESLGKRERQELRNWLAILIGHLLKWQYQGQPEHKLESHHSRTAAATDSAFARQPQPKTLHSRSARAGLSTGNESGYS